MQRLNPAILSDSFWLPERASNFSGSTDALFQGILWLSVFFFVLITVLLAVFIIKYRHREGVKRSTAGGHSTALELTWTIIPSIIVLVIYYYGFRGFLNLATEPPNCYEIIATGRSWNWSFTYPNGYVDPELHVPRDQPVRVIVTSEDVIHSLYIPAFRVKKDAVPGRYNRLWFVADQVGTYDVYCAAYCGTNHSQMLTKAIVHEPADFKTWLEKASNWEGRMTPVEAGKELYTSRGCAQCHSVDGSTLIGPSWKDMYGSKVQLTDGSEVTLDDALVRETIEYPTRKVRSGFNPVMPSYLGMKQRDIGALIAYMKSISVYYKEQTPTTKTSATAPATTQAAH